jgi:exopolysaccharide production protein ExoQ
MKQLLKDPLVFSLLLVVGIIYLLVIFNYVGRSKFHASLLEKFYIGLFIITIAGATGITLVPLTKLHPRVLSNPDVTSPTVVAQIGFYAAAMVLLVSRFRYTLRDTISVVVALLTRDIFLIAFLFLIGLSAFWSDTPSVTLKSSLVYLETSLIAIYVAKQYPWQELFKIAKWTSLILLILSFFNSLTGSGKDLDGAWQGVLGHKNQFCFMMVFTGVLWFINALYNPKQRNFSVFITLLSIVAINFGKSGASRVILVCLIGLWFYLGAAKKLSAQWAFVSVVLFMILSVCLTIIVTENLEFIVVDTLNKDLTLTGRTDFWPLIINKINERPFLGYGIDGFWQMWRGPDNPARTIIVAKTQFSPPHSHNGFLDLACDLGYVGLALFIASFVSSIAKAVIYLGQAKMPEAGLPLLVIAYILMTNMTETGLLGVTSIWFWYIVIAVRTSLDTTAGAVRSQERYPTTV